MERIDALIELLAKVEEGTLDDRDDVFLNDNWPARVSMETFWKAYCGSLDAANALHDVALPGCHFGVANEASGDRYVAEVFDCNADMTIGHGHAGNPARAWLIAILKALITQEGK